MGIYEVMRVNDKVRRLIAQKAGEDIVRDAAIAARHDYAGRGCAGEGEVGADQRRRAVPRRHRGQGSPHAVSGLLRPRSASSSWRARTAATRLNAGCPKCGRSLQSGWQFCPYCTTSTTLEAVEEAAARSAQERPSCQPVTSPNSRTPIVEELLRHAVGGARTRPPTKSRRRSAARSRGIIPTRSSTWGRSSRRWPRASPRT